MKLTAALHHTSRLTFVTGNHDRGIEALLKPSSSSCAVRLTPTVQIGPHCFLHGHEPLPSPAGRKSKSKARSNPPHIIMGHEHPCVWVGDGLTTSIRCPSFLVSDKLLILPAFSNWAAGSVVGRSPFLSPLAQQALFTQAIAILGPRLLPLRL